MFSQSNHNYYHAIYKRFEKLEFIVIRQINLKTSQVTQKMLRSQQYIKQGQPQVNKKLILNPLQLLAYELQSKDLNSKRQSIENVQIIALTMSETDIVNSLFPFLMKVMVEQNNKQLKQSIIKSFRNIFPLLQKQKSYLKLLEILIDTAIVFEQSEIRNEALFILNQVLFNEDLLDFTMFKHTFKGLVMTQLKQITQPSTAKNAKQLSFHLIKYLFHKSTHLTQDQTKQIIHFIKKYFVQNSESNDHSNVKIFAENLHLLVEKWPQSHIQDLDSLVNLFTGFKIPEVIKDKEISEQVAEPQQPQQQSSIKQKLPQLPQYVKLQVKCSSIPALIAYGKYFDLQKAHLIIQQLLKDQDPKIKIGLIKNSKLIFQTFKNQDLSSFLTIFQKFSQQTHDIKKAITEVIDEIQLDETTKNQSIIKYCKNTIDLKNILIQSLIKNNKSDSVGQILSESDYDFKVKIFMKLPDSLLHKNASYADIVDSLLSEPKKNFRSKLNIIMNLITRIEENVSKLRLKNKVQTIGQVFNVSYLIAPLIKYFGDRIAMIRVNVAKLYALIINYYKVDFSQLIKSLQESYYGENKGWFERQNILFMIKEYLEVRSLANKVSLSCELSLKNENPQFYSCIHKFLRNALEGIPAKTNLNQSHKVSIKNIQMLGSQIIKKYSLQQP